MINNGFSPKACLLKKYLYGLKQSPRQWYKRFDVYMINNGFSRSSYDSCVYFKEFAPGMYIYLLLYVDDMLIACKRKSEIEYTKGLLRKEFDMKKLGPARKILGMEISVFVPLGAHFKGSLKDCPSSDWDVERMMGLSSWGFIVGHAALKAASCKVTKHEKSCIKNQHVFVPFAFDTLGFLEPEVVELLNRVQQVMHSNVMTPRSTNIIFKGISFAIQKGLAAQLVACLPSTTKVFARDIYGDHAVSCTVGKEVDIRLGGGLDKPSRLADMLLYSWDGGLDVCVDLTVHRL
ncbi:retrovirus-related pol polyprotein from transposon TNT 1-94 [Tanacetum coccineum]